MLWIQLQRNVGQVPTPKPLTSGPWQQLGINFCEVAGHYVLVMNDYYSRFPEVDKVHSTGAKNSDSQAELCHTVQRPVTPHTKLL